jgi:FtsP/CotA-like multicopper oxidase with cupredoxin domain
MRAFLAGLVALLFASPAFAGSYDLVVDRTSVSIDGQVRRVISINGQIAGPTLRWTEGEEVVVNVINRLDVDTSIHWHGILVPFPMDGVPGLSFDGIKPGQTFIYRFTVRQAGTYWYHSHSHGQEQEGMYAPIVVTPLGGGREKVARDHVVMLSDSHPMAVGTILRKLKQDSDYFNDHRRTLPGLVKELSAAPSAEARSAILSDRKMWGEMRMDPTDLADVSGYTFLVNGRGPNDNWTGLFAPGERVRLRFINGAAMTIFDARIPGLRMTVVQADGQQVQPVAVDAFRIGPGETYDVIVEPRDARAYTIEAQSIDRRGFARATLAPRDGLQGPLPELRKLALLTMADMGMGDMDMADMPGMDHSKMGHAMPTSFVQAPPVDGPPGEKVLSYADLKRLDHSYPLPEPSRTVELRLTGIMDRYIWSMNDKKYSEQPALDFSEGETVRLVFKNETMMNHPMHLHGLWMILENGTGDDRPRKHTIIVPPGRTVSVLVTMDAVGRWSLHCHLLFHMETGMFREAVVHPAGESLPAAGTPAPAAMGGHAHHH